jgi:hypothetical protein
MHANRRGGARDWADDPSASATANPSTQAAFGIDVDSGGPHFHFAACRLPRCAARILRFNSHFGAETLERGWDRDCAVLFREGARPGAGAWPHTSPVAGRSCRIQMMETLLNEG